MNKKNGKINKKSKIKKFITSIIIIIFLIILIVGMGLTFFVGGIYKDWLGRRIQSMAMLEEYYNIIVIRGNEKRIRYFNPLNPFGDSPPTKIYDRNNILLANLFPEYGGFYKEVKYSDLPQNLIEAVISAEDKNFFKHKGIDYKAILRAFISNLLNRKIVSGGSTITQQLSKSIINRERNYINKFYEALDSIRLEKNLTKEEILTEYLNRIFFGNNCYGIGAAAELYFKKEVKYF